MLETFVTYAHEIYVFFIPRRTLQVLCCCTQFLVSSSLKGPYHIAHRVVSVIIGMCMKDYGRSNTTSLVLSSHDSMSCISWEFCLFVNIGHLLFHVEEGSLKDLRSLPF